MSDQDTLRHGEGTTHFGFREVPESEKATLVGQVFQSVAGKYDLMNDLMSLGIHRLWKRFTIDQARVRPGYQVLDVAGGTGDLGAALAERVGPGGRVVISDINPAMLEVGRNRLADKGIVGNVEFVEADAERLPFPDDSFDVATLAFGIRNMTHPDQALRELYRVLKPGGRVLILEFSHPTWPGVGPVYDLYSFHVLPRLGQWVAGDRDSYQYLVESIRRFPDQETFKGMMETVGFDLVEYFNLSGGIVALHKGVKI